MAREGRTATTRMRRGKRAQKIEWGSQYRQYELPGLEDGGKKKEGKERKGSRNRFDLARPGGRASRRLVSLTCRPPDLGRRELRCRCRLQVQVECEEPRSEATTAMQYCIEQRYKVRKEGEAIGVIVGSKV